MNHESIEAMARACESRKARRAAMRFCDSLIVTALAIGAGVAVATVADSILAAF